MRKNITLGLLLLLTIWAVPAQEKSASPNIKKTKSLRTAVTHFVRPLPEDAPLINVAAAAVKATPKISRLWKNYWSAKQAFIIYKPGKSAVLISEIAPPAPFEPLNPDFLPRKLRGKAYLHRGTLPNLNGAYDTNYPVGEIRAIAVNLGKTYETLALLFHEGFHEFQIGKKQFTRTEGADGSDLGVEARIKPEIISNAEFVALMEVERRILSEAVNTISYRNVVPLLRQYLAVRRKRTQYLPQDARESELNIERKEGSAALIGYEGASLSLRQDLNVAPEQIEISLGEYNELPKDTAYGIFRLHAYRASSAIAWLLTRMKVDWRQKLQQGASFEALLSEAVKFNPGEADSSAEDALKTFDFMSALKKAELWKSKLAPEITIADFYKKGKVRLVLEFSFTGKKFPEIKNTGTGLGATPEEKVSIEIGSQLFTINHPLVSLTSENHPQMSDFRKAPRVIQYTIMLNELPKIEGYESGKSQVIWRNGGSIIGEGLKLKVEKTAIIAVTNDAVTVNLGEL